MTPDVKSQSEILEKNVAATMAMQRREAEGRSFQDRVAAFITDFSGSMAFVYFHAIWFGLWMLLNLGFVHIPHVTQFDPYPFGLLTLVVSLEAIFLSTFVLIAQNNLAAVSERRAELDLQVNLLAEQKTAKVLDLLDTVARELDSMHSRFNYRTDAEIQALKRSPETEHVLDVIEQGTGEDAAGGRKKAGTISTIMDLVNAKVAPDDEGPEDVSKDNLQSGEDPVNKHD